MELIGAYTNGNYKVSIYSDGTKVRENALDFFEAQFPESMDIKLTNCCDMGCAMCHENSVPNGKHGDIMNAKFIETLHPYTELALGGGNVLEHPDLDAFLYKLKSLKMIPSMTVNQTHFMQNIDRMRKYIDEKLVYGIGVSVSTPTDEFIDALKEFPNAVVHVINGMTSMGAMEKLRGNHLKLLILGYKHVRRGEILYELDSSSIREKQLAFYNNLGRMLNEGWFDVVSFDNLAIKQLIPQRLVAKELWDEIYMGDDGIDGQMTSASMYIDVVEKKFAKNSCDMMRFNMTDNAEEMFQFLKRKEVP